MLLSLLLTFHLIGLVTMAGTTIVDYLAIKTLWKLPDQQTGLLQLSGNFSLLIRVGAALLILTGFGMMIITHGVFGEMLWFRIKFAIVIILVINGIIGTKRSNRFKTLLRDKEPYVNNLHVQLNRFYLSQLALFGMIIILSVFKFN
jgi:uncharacterized membrane protein SirB2